MVGLAARSKNNVIGNGNNLAWKSQRDDFKWFKEITMGQNLLMGRKTYSSLPVKLKGRTIFVLNNTVVGPQYTGQATADTSKVYHILKIDNLPTSDVILCGGASLYSQFLSYCSQLFLTEFDFEAKGDVVFPEFNHIFPHREEVRKIENGTIFKYSR